MLIAAAHSASQASTFQQYTYSELIMQRTIVGRQSTTASMYEDASQ
jgi:hypothetical protein